MFVIIANDLPPAVRGRLKLWFLEPRPNVFVSGIKDSTAEAVVEFLQKYCPPESGLLIVRSSGKPPFYQISCIGPPRKSAITVSGLTLILETLKD